MAGGRAADCASTTRACREASRRLLEQEPKRLVLVSPHAPRRGRAFAAYAPPLRGDLRRFGARALRVELDGDPDLHAALGRGLGKVGTRLEETRARELDHGALVPLRFLVEAGWRGPTTVLALSAPGGPEARRLGRGLAAACAALGGGVALVASGDLSHCLPPGGPEGCDPRALEFDRRIHRLLEEGKLEDLDSIPGSLRALAREDVVEVLEVLRGVYAPHPVRGRCLSYEHPFGVGYLVALLDPRRVPRREALRPLLEVAREAVRARLEGRPARGLPTPTGALARRTGLFVTWKQRSDGSLRGCIGHLRPRHAHLVAECAELACAAAFEDPRFPPVEREEFAELRASLSILDPPEAVRGPEALDPGRWGVIVSDGRGRRGVLLPRLAGVETVARQLQIARRKAGIPPHAKLRLERFASLEIAEDE